MFMFFHLLRIESQSAKSMAPEDGQVVDCRAHGRITVGSAQKLLF